MKDAKRELADKLTAIGEPTRLKILDVILANGGETVGAITKKIGCDYVNVSHHLTLMARLGILKGEKEGRFVRYSLADGIPDAKCPRTLKLSALVSLFVGQK